MHISEIVQSNTDSIIMDLMSDLRSSHDRLTRYSGFGHCALGSQLLGNRLEQLSIPFEYVTGMVFSKEPIAVRCRDHVNSIIAGMGSEIRPYIEVLYRAETSYHVEWVME